MTVGNIKVPLMAWKALAQKVNEMSINEPLYIIGRIQNTKQITHYYIDSSEVSYPFRVNALSISATPKEEL